MTQNNEITCVILTLILFKEKFSCLHLRNVARSQRKILSDNTKFCLICYLHTCVSELFRHKRGRLLKISPLDAILSVLVMGPSRNAVSELKSKPAPCLLNERLLSNCRLRCNSELTECLYRAYSNRLALRDAASRLTITARISSM